MVVIETALANILPRLEASPDLLGILVLRLICPYASNSMKAEWDDKQDRVQAKTLEKFGPYGPPRRRNDECV